MRGFIIILEVTRMSQRMKQSYSTPSIHIHSETRLPSEAVRNTNTPSASFIVEQDSVLFSMGITHSKLCYKGLITFASTTASPESSCADFEFAILPPELILHIIKLHGDPITMSAVCASMRRMCITHTQLWTVIDITSCGHARYLPLFIERSGDALLSVVIRLSAPSNERVSHSTGYPGRFCVASHPVPSDLLPSILAQISSVRHRVRGIKLDFKMTADDSNWAKTTLKHLTMPTQSLTSLSIHGVTSSIDIFPTEFLTDTHSNLIEFLFIGSSSSVPMIRRHLDTHSLTRLSLALNPVAPHNAEEEMMFLLSSHAATLVEVGLSSTPELFSLERHSPPFSSTSPIIVMPVLRLLILKRIVGPLESIDAPALRAFRFVSPHFSQRSDPRPDHTLMPCVAGRPKLLAFLERHAGTLEEIFICVKCSHSLTHKFTRQPVIRMPYLREFALEMWTTIQEQFFIIDAPILENLTLYPHGSKASTEIFLYANPFSSTLRILNISGSRTCNFLPSHPHNPPSSFPYLRMACLHAIHSTTYQELITQADCKGPYLGPGIDTVLDAIGPTFSWTAISTNNYNDVLIGAGVPFNSTNTPRATFQ